MTSFASGEKGDASNDDDVTNLDVQEGQEVSLECRYSPELLREGSSTLYWIRTNRNGHDNVAIGGTPFQENYRWGIRNEEAVI